MKKLFLIILLITLSKAFVFSQFNQVRLIDWWATACTPNAAPFNVVSVSSDTAWFYYNFEKCSPSSSSANALYRTTDSFQSMPLILSVGGIQGYLFHKISFFQGKAFLIYYYGADCGRCLKIWNSATGFKLIKGYTTEFWLSDCQLINNNMGFAISPLGVLYKYENELFDTLPQIQNCYDPKLFFSEDSLGFIICKDSLYGSYNTLLKTVDYGITWTRVAYSTNNELISLRYLNESTILLETNSKEIYKSTNNGTIWTLLMNLSYVDSYSIVNEDLVFGLKTNVLYRSVNIGVTWTNIQEFIYPTIAFRIQMIDSLVGYLYCHEGQFNYSVYKTINGGESFVPMNDLNSDISLYPNPATNTLNIDLEEQAALEIFNVQGQLVDTRSLTDNFNNLDISKLASGVYSLRIITDSGIAIRKLIKQL